MERITVVSVFDGKSGGLESLKRANILIDKYFSSEIKEDGITVALCNHPEIIQIGDITKCKYKSNMLYTEQGNYYLPNVNLFIGGSPCQDFSQANIHREGLSGTKSSLFFEWLRLKNEINANFWLLENVRMKPEHLKEVNSLMGCEPTKINSRLVSAQNRERYYWTNINNGTIPPPKDTMVSLNDILTTGYCPLEKSRCLMEGDSRPSTTPIKMYHRFHKFTTLIFKDKQHYLNCKEHYKTNFTNYIDNKFKNFSAKEIDISIVNNDLDLTVYDGIRYLNQTELERLQTLPEGYTKSLTRNKAAGVIGDGWNIETIAHIFSFLPSEWKTT